MKKDNPGLPLGSPRRRASSGKRKRTSASEETPRSEGAVLLNSSGVVASPDGLKRSRPERQESEPFGSYAYLFPDLDAFANAPANPNPPLSAIPQTQLLQPQQQQQQQQQQPPSNGPWGSTYPPQGTTGYPQPSAMAHQQQYPTNMPMPAPNMYTQPFQQSGFGLTLPPSAPPHSQPMQYTPDYSAMQNMPPRGAPAADDVERQRQLRAAVANLTSQEGPGATGGNMTLDQVEERRRAQDELSKSMQADGVFDWDQKTEAVQLITYHLNKWVAVRHDVVGWS